MGLPTRSRDWRLIPADGKGTFIGISAPFMGDWFKYRLFGIGERGTLNGAEWGNSQAGLAIFFTIKDENDVYQQAKCLLSDLNVTQLTFGSDEDRRGNLATMNPADAQARVGYYQSSGLNSPDAPKPVYWQFDAPNSPQHSIPLETFSYNGPRWISGCNSILTYIKAPDNSIQVIEFNVDTEEQTCLTTGPEDHFDAQMIFDPETSEQKYLACSETLKALALYEWDGENWEKLRTIVPPDIIPEDAPQYRVTGLKPFFCNGNFFFLYNVYNQFYSVKMYIASGDGTSTSG